MILYFSGTGNSRKVAEALAAELVMPMGDIMSVERDIASVTVKLVIWIFPIYSWGLPPVVVNYIKALDVSKNVAARHVMVCTCGDDIGLAHKQWRELLRKKGLNAGSAYSVQMPNTYTLLPGFDVDSKEVEGAKLAAMSERVKSVAERIKRNEDGDDVVTGSYCFLKSKIVYPLFVKFGCSTRPFKTSEACVGCGLCEKKCPTRNIVMIEGRPKWGDRCTMCLRCYHVCPHHAVEYGGATRKKGQYRTLLK